MLLLTLRIGSNPVSNVDPPALLVVMRGFAGREGK